MTKDIPTPEPEASPLFGKLPLAALAAGVLNIFGGATLGRAWITHLGTSYYDAMLDQFGVPVGVVTLDSTHLLTQGYEIARGSVAIYAGITLIVLPFVLLTTLATVGGWVRWRRARGLPEPRWLEKSDGPIERFFTALFPAVVLFALGWALFSIMFRLPEHARDAGTSAASVIRQQMMNGCSSCRTFGTERIVGQAIVADARGLYVATPGGGVALVPIAGPIINPAAVRPVPARRSGKRQ